VVDGEKMVDGCCRMLPIPERVAGFRRSNDSATWRDRRRRQETAYFINSFASGDTILLDIQNPTKPVTISSHPNYFLFLFLFIFQFKFAEGDLI
jgi:hypothetical protein